MCARILTLLELDENSLQVVGSLTRSNHNVIACNNFSDAIDVLKYKKVALIISDVHLENGGNVFDFLRWVKRNPLLRETQFVMFSSKPTLTAKYVEDGMRTSARILGAARYITMYKFDSDEFRKQIDSLLPKATQALEQSSPLIQ